MLLNEFVAKAIRRPSNQLVLRQFALDSVHVPEPGRLYFNTATGDYVAFFSETSRTRQVAMRDYVFVPATVSPGDEQSSGALLGRVEEDTILAVMAAANPETLSELPDYTPR